MTRAQREARVTLLVELAHEIVDDAIATHQGNRRIVATALLYSGGNDSTVLAHMFRHRATTAIHANTGIGVEKTREFVRATCSAWGIPLIERHPPVGGSYRDLVLSHGFPGPGQHFKMYQRLKERCLEQAKAELISNPYRERVVFLAGRRRAESSRRAAVPMHERNRSTIWASPLVLWTAPDMTTYRLMSGDVPTNEVSDLIHMSGECLCGSFAQKDELDEVGGWFPDVRVQIEALEAEIAEREDIPPMRRRWGWGAYRGDAEALMARSRSGPLCTSCEVRAHGGTIVVVPNAQGGSC